MNYRLQPVYYNGSWNGEASECRHELSRLMSSRFDALSFFLYTSAQKTLLSSNPHLYGSDLRRFTRDKVQYPTYKACAELGKAIKTIFLCRYLHSEALRREINEGSLLHWSNIAAKG